MEESSLTCTNHLPCPNPPNPPRLRGRGHPKLPCCPPWCCHTGRSQPGWCHGCHGCHECWCRGGVPSLGWIFSGEVSLVRGLPNGSLQGTITYHRTPLPESMALFESMIFFFFCCLVGICYDMLVSWRVYDMSQRPSVGTNIIWATSKTSDRRGKVFRCQNVNKIFRNIGSTRKIDTYVRNIYILHILDPWWYFHTYQVSEGYPERYQNDTCLCYF